MDAGNNLKVMVGPAAAQATWACVPVLPEQGGHIPSLRRRFSTDPELGKKVVGNAESDYATFHFFDFKSSAGFLPGR
jgi:hypothetical protein